MSERSNETVRRLLITVDAEAITCGDCGHIEPHGNGNNACVLFDWWLRDDKRLPECIAAEEAAKEAAKGPPSQAAMFLGLDEGTMDRAWNGALANLHARGVDVDDLLARAAKNVEVERFGPEWQAEEAAKNNAPAAGAARELVPHQARVGTGQGLTFPALGTQDGEKRLAEIAAETAAQVAAAFDSDEEAT